MCVTEVERKESESFFFFFFVGIDYMDTGCGGGVDATCERRLTVL